MSGILDRFTAASETSSSLRRRNLTLVGAWSDAFARSLPQMSLSWTASLRADRRLWRTSAICSVSGHVAHNEPNECAGPLSFSTRRDCMACGGPAVVCRCAGLGAYCVRAGCCLCSSHFSPKRFQVFWYLSYSLVRSSYFKS